MNRKTVIIESLGGIGHGTTVKDAETGEILKGVRHIDITIPLEGATLARVEIILPTILAKAEANILYEIPPEMADDVFFVNGRPHKLVTLEQPAE